MPAALKPEDQRRRANKVTSARQLPSSGRHGPLPVWPLSKMVAGEKALWAELWVTPQSYAWEPLGWVRTVARYCRTAIAAEKPGAGAAVLAECRQFEDRLGLTPLAMMRLHWSIVDDEPVNETPAVAMLDDYRAQVAEG